MKSKKHNKEIEILKDDILNCIIEQGGNATFAELSQNVKKINGDCTFNIYKKYPNVILWNNMPEEAIEAILQLDEEGRIIMSRCDFWVYLHDGISLGLPIAKRLRGYKKPHWWPVMINREQRHCLAKKNRNRG